MSVIANSIFTEVSDHRTWISSVLNGSETPKVTVNDAQRFSYLNSINANSSGGDSGGANSWLGLLILSGIALWRRKSSYLQQHS